MEIKKFSITVFGSILGTGGVALASQTFAPLLTLFLTYLLSALFILFTGLFVLKAIRYPGAVKAELQHPLPGNFYALQPISAVILAILFRRTLPSPIDIGLLAYGGVVILALAAYLPYHFFSNMNVEFSQLHGGWFITPVATVLVTNAVLLYPPSEVNLIISLLYLGIGTMLFLLVLSVLFFRLLSHDLPSVELAPTNYIMLAPIGILIVDFLQVSKYAGPFIGANLVPLAALVGLGLWGFGVWAVLVNLLLLRKYIHAGFPFHIGWWSYVFPTAAFTLGTVSLSKVLPPLGVLSSVMYLFLLAIWGVVSLGSLRHWLKPPQGRTQATTVPDAKASLGHVGDGTLETGGRAS